MEICEFTSVQSIPRMNPIYLLAQIMIIMILNLIVDNTTNRCSMSVRLADNKCNLKSQRRYSTYFFQRKQSVIGETDANLTYSNARETKTETETVK